MLRPLVIGALAAMASLAGWSGELELARSGQTGYTIIRSAQPSAAEQYAVEDLSACLQRATGARFVVVPETDAATPPGAIYVGWTDFARTQGIDASTLGDDEWVIRSFGKSLVLTGGRPRGTLFAVYEFLEQLVGCHWFDEFTETVPSRPDLILADANIRGQPAFWDRHIYTAIESSSDDEARITRFRVRNEESTPALGYGGACGSPNHCHTFYHYSKEWPATHPEYLSLNPDGTRALPTSGVGPGQICLTHPDVRRLMLEQLRGFIARDREAAGQAGRKPPRIYAIAPNDNNSFCQCPECRAFCEREGSISGPLIDLANALADGIRTDYPDVWVQIPAYMATLKPPRMTRPRDNVMVIVAQLNTEWPAPKDRLFETTDLFRPLAHPVNRTCYDALVGWSAIARHMAVWDYWILYSFNYEDFPSPYVNLRCLIADLELFHAKQVETMFVECELSETTSFFALKRWLGLKLMQDPDQAPAALVRLFMDGFYGPAATKMMAYLDYMEEQIAAAPETEELSGRRTAERAYLTLDFYRTCQGLIDEAETLCGTQAAALLNVQRERIPLDSGLYCMWEQLAKQVPAGQTMPWRREEILQRYATTRQVQMEARRSKSKLPEGMDDLQKELEKLRQMPLTEKGKRG